MATATISKRLADGARRFFYADAADTAQATQDHVVHLVQRDPVAGTRLIEGLALFSGAGNVAVFLACSTFLCVYWPACGSCSRPLRWWLLVQALLQLVQLPARVVLVHLVREYRSEDVSAQRLVSCLASLTSSTAWSISKSIAMLQYGWFVLGVIWWMHVDACPTCPGISKLTAAVMMLTVLRAVAALAAYRAMFPQGTEDGRDGDGAPKVTSATAEQISALPVVHFSTSPDSEYVAGGGDPDASCSICLCDYSEGSRLRRLPCGHEFHRRCVDRWLQRNKHCPLCIQPVDLPPLAKSRSTCSTCHDKAQ